MTGHNAAGVPYALPTDALIDYPATSLELANVVAGGGSVRIADSLLAAPAAAFDFQSIPQTYGALQCVLDLRGSQAADVVNVLMRFNADATGNYNYVRLYGNGTSAVSDNGVSQAHGLLGGAPAASAYAAARGMVDILIPNYAASVGHSAVSRAGMRSNTNFLVHTVYTQWTVVAAINRLQILPDVGQWAAGSRATLYGLRGT